MSGVLSSVSLSSCPHLCPLPSPSPSSPLSPSSPSSLSPSSLPSPSVSVARGPRPERTDSPPQGSAKNIKRAKYSIGCIIAGIEDSASVRAYSKEDQNTSDEESNCSISNDNSSTLDVVSLDCTRSTRPNISSDDTEKYHASSKIEVNRNSPVQDEYSPRSDVNTLWHPEQSIFSVNSIKSPSITPVLRTVISDSPSIQLTSKSSEHATERRPINIDLQPHNLDTKQIFVDRNHLQNSSSPLKQETPQENSKTNSSLTKLDKIRVSSSLTNEEKTVHPLPSGNTTVEHNMNNVIEENIPGENVYESAAKLLFLGVKWARSIPSFMQV